MLVSDLTLTAINSAMSDVVNSGYKIANRVQNFSQTASKIEANSELGNVPQNHDLSAELGELAKQMARYQTLGRLASGELSLYSLVASDGKA